MPAVLGLEASNLASWSARNGAASGGTSGFNARVPDTAKLAWLLLDLVPKSMSGSDAAVLAAAAGGSLGGKYEAVPCKSCKRRSASTNWVSVRAASAATMRRHPPAASPARVAALRAAAATAQQQ